MRAMERGMEKGRKRKRERVERGVGRKASLLSWKIRGFGYLSLGIVDVVLVLLIM